MTMSITASHDLAFASLGSLTLSGAEISAYDAASKQLFVTSNTGLQIVSLSDPAAPSLASTIAIATLGRKRIPSSLRVVPKGMVPRPRRSDWLALWVGVATSIALVAAVIYTAICFV